MIELHDSTVGSIVKEGSLISVKFSPAVVHKSVGRPGVDDGTSEIQNATLVFEAGRIEGVIGDLPAEILDGELHTSSRSFPNAIFLPCHISDEEISLRLNLYPDYLKISISGTGLNVMLTGHSTHSAKFYQR